jgi:rhodanese-related sulfurtransferase
MPAFGSVISSNEIDDVTLAIGRWSRTPVVTPTPNAAALPSLDEIVIHPQGPHPELTLREGRFVSIDVVKKALDSGARLVVLDARPLSDWHRGHIPGAFPTPFYDELGAIAKALPRDGTWIIAYCACPHAASGKVVDALRELGFPKTAVLDEGIVVWGQRGYPMKSTAAKPAAQ